MKKSLYKMPAGKTRLGVKPRTEFASPEFKPVEIVTVDKVTECHVTPPDIAARMVEYLGPCGDKLTLEPSAGTGNLTRALLDAGQSQFEICQIERHIGLCNHLYPLAPVINQCFLEYAEQARGKFEYPRVIMNPPFRKVKEHVKAAISLMGKNGHVENPRLVALVPSTFHYPGMETIENLESGVFAATNVYTKIIAIET